METRIDWDKCFPIASSVSRRLLKESGLPDEEIAQLTDEDMTWIAGIMAQNLEGGLYSTTLRHLASIALRDKS